MDLSRLLALRTLTNALAEHFARQAREYLANLGLLFQPRILLGELIRYEKCQVKGIPLHTTLSVWRNMPSSGFIWRRHELGRRGVSGDRPGRQAP